MRIIGLTGGIGSGKSTVARMLEHFGAYVIQTDELARQVVEPGQPAFDDIVAHFGPEILEYDGHGINRPKLADIVFNNDEELAFLNTVTHKRITERIHKEVATLRKIQNAANSTEGICNGRDKKKDMLETVKFIVIEVPLPVKDGFLDIADQIWLVKSEDNVRIQRLCEQRNFTVNEAKLRMDNQPSNSEYESIADVIINNNGDQKDTEQQVKRLLQHL